MKTLRLLFTQDCHRSCEGCCNKQWDLEKLPRVDHFNYEEIIITSGDPLLHVEQLIGFIKALRIATKAKIYVYTALLPSRTNFALYKIMPYVDGVTFTLHDQLDAKLFEHVLFSMEADRHTQEDFTGKSLRLNVFKGIELPTKYDSLSQWKIKSDIEWIEDCPLPPNEEFKRI